MASASTAAGAITLAIGDTTPAQGPGVTKGTHRIAVLRSLRVGCRPVGQLGSWRAIGCRVGVGVRLAVLRLRARLDAGGGRTARAPGAPGKPTAPFRLRMPAETLLMHSGLIQT